MQKNSLENLKDPKAFTNNMPEVCKNIEEYNPSRKYNILIVLDDMIADMISNKKLSPIVTELFIRERKLNISTAFFTKSYFQVPKDGRLNLTHFFIMKITNKSEFQQITCNHLLGIGFEDFRNLHQICTAKTTFFFIDLYYMFFL